MSSDSSRRFTDREVAVVLRKASEIDERSGSGAVGGLSLEDLTEIAREVGISAEAITRAVETMDHNRALGPAWAGAPLVRKAVHAVPGELDQDAMARLVRIVDEHTDSTGTISEALGSVRWTSSDRFRSSLVSITPENGETTIRVVEKAVPRVRRIMQLIPAAWGVMVAAPVAGGVAAGLAGGLALTALGAAAGAVAGRAAWTFLSAQSRRRVERLAATLSQEARAASERALPDGGPEDG